MVSIDTILLFFPVISFPIRGARHAARADSGRYCSSVSRRRLGGRSYRHCGALYGPAGPGRVRIPQKRPEGPKGIAVERCDAGLPERLILFRRNNEEENEADALNNIGVIHKLQGRYGKAMEFYEKSLEIKKRLGDRMGAAFSSANMGLMAEKQGRLDLAIRYMEEARDILLSIGSTMVKKIESQLRNLHHKARQ